jgi:hypothetical protein
MWTIDYFLLYKQDLSSPVQYIVSKVYFLKTLPLKLITNDFNKGGPNKTFHMLSLEIHIKRQNWKMPFLSSNHIHLYCVQHPLVGIHL